ncbi:armadillo-like helical domain-containing protein 4 isoform X3 [Prinia subflava]|uniref:armadillo-like helical domain-containing protein 4 isoform X3 n=1 Tax=Prinia subflava TaxID=208062 RepID=UPI002FE0C826
MSLAPPRTTAGMPRLEVEVSGFVSLAGFWTHLLSAMRRSKGFDICVVTCSILLLSSSLPCLAYPLEERDVTKVQHGPWAGNGLEDERTGMVDLTNSLGPSEQPVSEEPCAVSAKPSGTPLDEALTAEGEALPASPSLVVPSSQGLGGHPSAGALPAGHEEELAPTEAQLEEEEALRAMLTTAVTTLSPPAQEQSGGPAGETTTEGGVAVEPSSAGPSASPLSGTTVEEEEEAESSSQPSAGLQPTLEPSSPSWAAAGDHPVIPTPQAVTSELEMLGVHTGSPLKSLAPPTSVAAKHPLVATEAFLHPAAGTGVTQQELPSTAGTVTIPPVDTVPPDWDDTKLGHISQGGSTAREEVTEELGTTEPSQTTQEGVGEEEDATRAVPSPVSPPPAPELAKESNCTVPVQGEELPATSTGSSDAFHTGNLSDADTADLGSLENISAVTAEEEKSVSPSQPEAAVVTDTQPELSPTLESSWKGVTQEVPTAAQEADAALSAVAEVPGATQGAGAASFPQENSGEDTQMLTAPSGPEVLVATGAPSTVSPVDAEDLTDGILVTSEKAAPAPGGMSPTPAGQTEEPSSRTVVLVTPASVASSGRRTALPPGRRISTAVTYGLERLESEGTPGPQGQVGSCGGPRLP